MATDGIVAKARERLGRGEIEVEGRFQHSLNIFSDHDFFPVFDNGADDAPRFESIAKTSSTL